MSAPTPVPGSGHPLPRVSVVIVNYNGAQWLRDCLGALRHLDYPDYEVLVVDNASTDASLEILPEFPFARVIRSERNLGFAGGNNLGLRHATGPYVLLLNSDTIAHPHFLRALVDYLEAHPRVGVAQGKMLLPRFQDTLDVCGSFLTPLGFQYHYGYYKPDGPKYQRSYPVFSGKGACLIFRRDVVARVGGYLFNEDFFCYYEETDFCHRVWLAGYEVHFVASPPIRHLMGATTERTQQAWFNLSHYLGNQTFGLLANLSPASRWRILPLYFGVFLASMAAALVTARRSVCIGHWLALVRCAKSLKQIRRQRTMIAQIRVVSDQAIWRTVMKMPRLSYFVKTFTGRLRDYVDDDLPAVGGS